MRTGTLIAFNLPRKEKGISVADASKFYRELYGYNNHSFYGKYKRRVNGLLDDIGGVLKLSRSQVILVKKQDAKKVVSFLKQKNAKVLSWEVSLFAREKKELGLEKN